MKAIFSCLVLFATLFSCKSASRPSTGDKLTTSRERFQIDHIVDTSGNEVALDFSGSDINIIDIWNNACPPCLEEMRQFPALIRYKEGKVTIFSISLTRFYIWKTTVKQHRGPFAILSTSLPNWKQYNFMSVMNSEKKSDFSSDRFVELIKKYNITSNPAYLVLNNKGEIIARPSSAVEYLSALR